MKIQLVLFFLLTISLSVHLPLGNFSPIQEVYADPGDAWCDISSTVCDDAWGLRMEVIVDHTKVSDSDTADFTNFPVMVHISGSTFTNSTHGLDFADSSLEDIRFLNSTSDGLLDYEIVKYDKTDNEMVAYVEVPILDYNDNTKLYMYYNNTGSPTDQQNISGTWNSGYAMVQHMNEASSHIIDSTSNDNDSVTIDAGMSYGQAGKFGDAIDFNANSNFQITSSSSIAQTDDTVTTSYWTKNNIASGTYPSLFDKQSGEPYLNFIWSETDYATASDCSGAVQWGMNFRLTTSGGKNDCIGGTDVTDNNWYHITSRYDGSTVEIWVNGVVDGSVAETGNMVSNSADFVIGSYNDAGAFYYDGLIHGFRVSTGALSDGWIETEYANENSPSTFYALTVEENGTGHDPILSSDTWTFVETTDVIKNNVVTASDTWAFVESTNQIGHFVLNENDVWTFVENTDQVFATSRNGMDSWTFVETVDVEKSSILSISDEWTFVETADRVGHYIRSASDVWTFVENVDQVSMSGRNGIDNWTFVESIDVTASYIREGTDTWTFVENTDVTGASERIALDTWSFVETTGVIQHYVREGTDVWTFVETTDEVFTPSGHDPISASDVFTFVETTDVIGMGVRSGIDTWTFVESANVTKTHTVINVGDVWTFVENTDVLFDDGGYDPDGVYIWFNISPPELNRLGGIFSASCPGGFYVSGISTNGTLICTQLP